MKTRKRRTRSSKKNIHRKSRAGTGRSKRCAKRPNEVHKLRVSAIHTICYYEFGNPAGEPVFVIHGGPGDHSRVENARMFDCRKYRVIFIDQRGCGRSTPFCEIKENTTQDLVEDIEKVRIASGLGHRKVQLFGMSWGTFLSLSYAIRYPDNVSRIVLRSVFLCTRDEYNDVENGKFVRKMFPDIYEEYVNVAEDPERATDEYYDKILGDGPDSDKYKYLKKVSKYEEILLSLRPNGRKLKRTFSKNDMCLARLEAHYFRNRCFARDIMAKIHRIRHIPMTIVHGRYDAVTPAYYAYKLHKALPKSKIQFTVAGHMMTDEENYAAVSKIFGGVV